MLSKLAHSIKNLGRREPVVNPATFNDWKGRQPPDQVFDPSTLKHCTPLSRIHALQLIAERCHGKNQSYYSYELNLVLDDGQRINVVDHGNCNALREDARALAAFLGKPVWDAT